jgi:hypothetical protein
MFDDKVGGWGWLNDDVIKNIQGKKLCLRAQINKNKPYLSKRIFFINRWVGMRK